jgi:hypothetical protein
MFGSYALEMVLHDYWDIITGNDDFTFGLH